MVGGLISDSIDYLIARLFVPRLDRATWWTDKNIQLSSEMQDTMHVWCYWNHIFKLTKIYYVKLLGA